MDLQWFLALATFCLVTVITPGPNNTMLMASGLNFGPRATVPHGAAVTIGFPVMVLVVGLGFGQVFVRQPLFYAVLQFCSFAYLLWLAWVIATAPVQPSPSSRRRPMTGFQAAAFQWINPKAWTMAVGANATFFLPANPWMSVFEIALAYLVLAIGSSTLWILGGHGLRRLLHRPALVRGVNIVLATSLLASIAPETARVLSRLQ